MMTNLPSLPTELLHLITTHLPPSARLSLKLTNKTLFIRTPQIPPSSFKTSSPCEHNALNRYIDEHELLVKDQRRCVLCDGVQAVSFFDRDDVPICRWHEGWLFHLSLSVNLEAEVRERLEGIAREVGVVRWIAFGRLYCAHEKEIVGWDVPDCGCECESCGHFEVECYVRVSPSGVKPLNCQLGCDKAGRLWVREEHFARGDVLRSYIDVPIVDIDDFC